MKPKICPRCDTINESDSSYCKKCTAILDDKMKYQIEENQAIRSKVDAMMNLLVQDEEFRTLLLEKMNNLGGNTI